MIPIKKISILCFALVFGLAILPSFVYAQLGGAREALQNVGERVDPKYRTGTGYQNIYTMVGQILQAALGFTGTILFIVIGYAGFQWLLAGGDQEKVKNAKKWIFNAVIGMIIIATAWILTSFVLQALRAAGN